MIAQQRLAAPPRQGALERGLLSGEDRDRALLRRSRAAAGAGARPCDHRGRRRRARRGRAVRASGGLGALRTRIVCLTEEPTEVLYALGEEQRIVGISGFTVRPARARREKPKVSAFTSAKVDRILELEPDFVDRVLRYPGRYCPRAHQGGRRGVDQQSSLGGGHPGLRAPSRRAGRRCRSAPSAMRSSSSGASRRCAPQAAALAAGRACISRSGTSP